MIPKDGNKSNIGGSPDSDGVISDSQKVNSPSSGFPTTYSGVPSLSTDSMSPTSSLTSLREDADSGDHGQSSVSGTDYIPLFDRDKFRGNDANCIDGLKAHGLASWDTVLQCTAELNADPSLASFPSFPSSSLANIHDQEQNTLGDFSMSRSGAGGSQHLQPNWQIPFEDNTGHMPTLTQSLSLEFGSDYGTGLLGNEAHNENSEIDPIMFSFHGEPTEKLAHQNYLGVMVDGLPQVDLKSNSANEVPSEETINYPLSVRRTLLDRDESLRKVDSFNRWITKALGEVDNLNMQSSPGISWSTDECGHVIDETSLSPSLSQDQLYSINDFSPKWADVESDTEVLIIGSFLKSQPDVTTYNWSCMFGEVEVPAEVVANGILCCQAPPHKVGRVPFYVTCSNRLACSEVREFDFREGYSRNVDYTEFFDSSNEMLFHLRLEEFLSLKPVHPSNQTFEGDTEKRNLILKLISLREEEEYSIKEERAVEMDVSRHRVKKHLFHRQVKLNLYSWLLHKVTESGKGPNVLDKDGQGVLHLAAVLDYDWAITPILIAGVNINFRDVNGWTALHWAASCGRQVKLNLYSWLLHKVTESGKGPNVLDKDGQGVLHLAAVLDYDWAITPILIAGVNINFRDVNGWTALHWAASCGRERTVAALVSMGADCGALTDPSPEFPSGRTAADLASSNGHKGLSGFLAESSLTSHLEALTVDDQQKGGLQEVLGTKAVQTVSERTATPVYSDMPDALCLKDSLTAVRNATQAADRIHQVFRMQSFQRKQLTQDEDDEFGLLDQRALSLLASKASKSRQGDGIVNDAATQIQKKFRGWKKRKEFLIIRQRIVKIQAHVRGHQVRKQYKTVIWSVGILEKIILRWRRKGSGLRGFRPETLNKAPSQQNDSPKEDDYDYLKEGRKQKEEKIEKALSRVKSMVQYPEARAQYRRVLNVVEDFRQKKDCNMGLISSEETVDGVEDLIDIDMLLDDDNFNAIAFDSL
ncbi:hypothetical protein TSUD_389370 [Trifolium subterraneum]|uniref:IPT/TIG domain-containing protein n=1 Tax=Trifolium subterraneum TaxID=3900 RepID=A0A2Z6NF68_TRISU|nr:hypothetical protein TSUD_389370 [Trifolium subterraneum]